MNYNESVRYLLTLGRELASPQQARAAKFDLRNIREICERMDHPERKFASVHVAGTNGKGSTAAMLASIVQAAGQAAGVRCGLYTSPHLLRINERIRLDGADVSDDEFAASFTRVLAIIEELLASGTLAAHPTYFECVTAMAFDSFARAGVDLAVIEVGLGGRLDSTNVIVPEVAVITQIDFDHENFLGHSIEEIAAEKAGIIKPGVWVVSAAANPAAGEVIHRRAAEQEANLVEIDNACQVSHVTAEDGRYRFRAALSDRLGSATARELEIALPLAGRFQVRNAITAVAAARLLALRGLAITDTAVVRGIESVRWPGRLERLQERPAVYLDGTHNPAGAREVLAFWREHLTGRRIHVIYGAMRDKAIDEVAGLLFPHAATVILTQSPQPRSLSAEALAQMTTHLASEVEVIREPGAALERALEIAEPDDVIFATGSLYLVGDLRRHWDSRLGVDYAGAVRGTRFS
jgi:dihydrofolate synthase / folylpolyglutamate synthase